MANDMFQAARRFANAARGVGKAEQLALDATRAGVPGPLPKEKEAVAQSADSGEEGANEVLKALAKRMSQGNAEARQRKRAFKALEMLLYLLGHCREGFLAEARRSRIRDLAAELLAVTTCKDLAERAISLIDDQEMLRRHREHAQAVSSRINAEPSLNARDVSRGEARQPQGRSEELGNDGNADSDESNDEGEAEMATPAGKPGGTTPNKLRAMRIKPPGEAKGHSPAPSSDMSQGREESKSQGPPKMDLDEFFRGKAHTSSSESVESVHSFSQPSKAPSEREQKGPVSLI